VKTDAGPLARARGKDRIFDRSGALTVPTWRAFLADHLAVVIDYRRFRTAISTVALPRGDGHPVIVIPGFLCGDVTTRGFRRLLARLGYDVAGWGAGMNLGPTTAALASIDALLRRITDRRGERASLVGQSLGGVLARALACEHPTRVRRVITVCSPFRLPTASRFEPVYRMLSPLHQGEGAVLCRLALPPSVPTTAIYTREDGVVTWTSCIDEPGPDRENVAIRGAHTTMLGNPEAVRVITDRLARPSIL
jgi:hypothetical protein